MELGGMSTPGNGLPTTTNPPPSFSSPEKPTERAKELGLRQGDTRLDISDNPLRGEEKEEDNPKGGGERTPLLERDDVENPTVDGEWRGGPRPEESLAEIEIRSLLWIKRPENQALREAYETWQAKDTLFASRVDRKRKLSSSLMNEIYQLIGFYSVFQGVLLTAVVQPTYLTCYNWWTAFFLSLLASLVTVGGLIQKFLSRLSLEKTIANEEVSRKDCIRRVQRLLHLRENFQLRDVPDIKRPVPKQTSLKVSAVVVVLILLLFSALFLVSIRRILCNPGFPAPAPAPAR